MCGFDETGGSRIIAESLADLADGDFQNSVTDKGLPPNRVEEFFFCHELSRPPDEMVEHSEGFGCELYGL